MIKVLVVDDSAVVRQAIIEILSRDRAIHVMAAVADPLFAMQRMRADWPDVIVLDIEMPRMDGLTFLKQLMAQRPTPVVICSTLTTQGAATTVQALAAGAVAAVSKPRLGVRSYLLEQSASLLHAVKAAATRSRSSHDFSSATYPPGCSWKAASASSRAFDAIRPMPEAMHISAAAVA